MKINKYNIGQRGVTLVELVVSLALIAIMSVSIVSLCMVLSNLSVSSSRTYDKIEDLTMTREYIFNWFHSFDEEGTIYTIENNMITIYNDNSYYRISQDGEVINIEYPEEKTNPELTSIPLPTSFTLSGLNNIKFESYDENRIYKCIITYNENEFSFLLARRSIE